MLDGAEIRDGGAETAEEKRRPRKELVKSGTHEPTIGVYAATLIPPIAISVSKRTYEVVVLRLPWIRPL